LHDWIDELCDALDIDAEFDESLVLDVARDAAHNVERPAAPITTYLLGYAAAMHEAGPERLERLAGAAIELAEKWGGEDEQDLEDDDLEDVEGGGGGEGVEDDDLVDAD
jgi:hypothetical protein